MWCLCLRLPFVYFLLLLFFRFFVLHANLNRLEISHERLMSLCQATIGNSTKRQIPVIQSIVIQDINCNFSCSLPCNAGKRQSCTFSWMRLPVDNMILSLADWWKYHFVKLSRRQRNYTDVGNNYIKSE